MSNRLFHTDFGEPLYFSLSSNPPLKAQIEAHGGQVVPLSVPHSLHLIPNAPNSLTNDSYEGPVYAEAFVQACIDSGEILPLCDFQVFSERKARRRCGKLSQKEVNEVVRFVKEHPEKEHGAGYWDWVSVQLSFASSAKLLQKTHLKHISALRRQGFLPREKPTQSSPPVEIREYCAVEKPVESPCSLLNVESPVWGPEVIGLFDQLVERCQAQTRAKVTKTEVLRALLRHQGRSQTTIQSFLL